MVQCATGCNLSGMKPNLIASDTPNGNRLPEAAQITDKKGYARRWPFSARHIDNLLAQGLPHLRIGVITTIALPSGRCNVPADHALESFRS